MMKPSRSPGLADALFSKTKKAAIGILFSQPGQGIHLRELARVAGVSAPMMAKEVDVLVAAGILLEQRDGNRRVVSANPDSPIFDELRGIATKTAGLADILRARFAGLEGITVAFVFGSVARGEERAGSDIDVCVVGSVANRDVMAAASAAGRLLRREVNAVTYAPGELRDRIAARSVFVTRMIASPRIFIVGDEDGFEDVISGCPERRKDRGTRRSAR